MSVGVGNILLDPDTFQTNVAPAGKYMSISGDTSASGHLIVGYGTQYYTPTTENDSQPPTVIGSINWQAPSQAQKSSSTSSTTSPSTTSPPTSPIAAPSTPLQTTYGYW
jgi:hypothetical protein